MTKPSPASISPANRVPAAAEPIARGVIEFLGGRMGTHARVGRARWWTPLRVIIAVGWSFLALGFLSKANCAGGRRGEDGAILLNWDGNRNYTSFCYSDIIPLYGGRGMDQGGFPYAFSWQEGDVTRYMEYPVLAGLFQGLMGWISRATYPVAELFAIPAAGWYFAVTAAVLSCIWVGVLAMVYRLTGNRAWDTILVAASPLVIIHAFTNWDIPSIALAVAGLLAASRGRYVWAGALLGLGTAFKLWPLFLLGAFFVVAWRNRRWVEFIKMALSCAFTWLAVNLPVALAYPAAWREFYRLNETRGAEWTTIYAILSRNLGVELPPSVLNAVGIVLFLAVCAAIAAFGILVPRQPRVAELAYLIVVGFLLVNKVWSPQYSLWLVIPAVLALPRWRLLLSWMLVDAAVWPILMWHMLGAGNNGVPHELLDLAVLGRDGLIIAIAVCIIRQMLGLSSDKVAAAHRGADPLLERKFQRC